MDLVFWSPVEEYLVQLRYKGKDFGPVSRDVGGERGKWRKRKNVWCGYLRKELFRQGDSGYKDPSS